jgi:calcineurin-like phosphoesterase family protein
MCKRPFLNVEEMHEEIVTKWNSKVTDSDTTFLIGDISHKANPNTVKSILDRLNGKIILIIGNHDNSKIINKVSSRFESIHTDYIFEDKFIGNNIHIYHYPVVSWRGKYRGSYHLFGHCHGNLKLDLGLAIDIGVDSHDFYPISSLEVKNIMDTKQNLDLG